jgi:hypothetical protein
MKGFVLSKETNRGKALIHYEQNETSRKIFPDGFFGNVNVHPSVFCYDINLKNAKREASFFSGEADKSRAPFFHLHWKLNGGNFPDPTDG